MNFGQILDSGFFLSSPITSLIIIPTESSKVRFTSGLIFRACLDAVIPKRRHIRVQHEDLGDPIDLLCLALRYISPAQIMVPKVHNKAGPSENIFHVELYAVLRDLVPENWYCSPEVRETKASQKRLDFTSSGIPLTVKPARKDILPKLDRL
jgi:hypothetical protein